MRTILTCAILTAAAICGCGGKSPPEVCDEYAGDFSSAFARCGVDGAQAREVFLQKAASGSCTNVIAIRDEDSLYADCLPWWQHVSCDVLATDASAVPQSCKSQLEVK